MIPPELENNPIVLRLKGKDPHWVAEAAEFRGELTVVVPREQIRLVCEFLRSDPEMKFTFLSDLSGVDRFPTEPRFEVNYHLVSLSPEVYSINYVPLAPRAIDGVLVAVVAIGISFVATLYPSWSAARILPAEALRYE